MESIIFREDANFPDDAFSLPGADDDGDGPSSSSSSVRDLLLLSENKRKRKRVEIEVIDSGVVARAPMPVEQVERLEAAAGAQKGTYFVELMRKRLRCIRDIQVKWATRTCNRRRPKYVETQTRLKDFAEVVLDAFTEQFGPQSSAMIEPPTRKQHAKPNREKQ
jgi:hypothetical protein